MQELPPGTNRRAVLRATAALSAAAAAVAAVETTSGAAVATTHPSPGHAHALPRARQHGKGPRTGEQRLRLTATGSGDLKAITVALDAQDFRRDHGAWVSRTVFTTGFTMAALTWAPAAGSGAEPDTGIRVRTPAREGWRAWQHLPAVEDGPDRGPDDASAARATSLAWTGAADSVEVRLVGAVPRDLRLHLVLSEPTLADRAADRRTVPARPTTYRRSRTGLGRDATRGRDAALVPNIVPQPTVLSRAAWGANEAWRSGSPRYNNTIAQVHVHHTATNNGYADTEVPALIRGMYYYHTHTLGWSDIAYNFLVDIFGRIWEGRYGGIDQPVRGAHTLGFNAQSTGFSVIGNYQLVQPTQAVLTSLSALAAWKLYPYGRDPLGVIAVTSEGSDKFRDGVTVTLPVIDGHRDTNDTACPGNYVYAQLQNIRAMTKLGMGQGTISVTTPFAVVGDPVVGETLTVQTGVFSPPDAVPTYSWQRDGATIPDATSATYVVAPEDVGHVLTAVVSLSRVEYVTLSQSVPTTAQVMSPAGMRLRGAGHSDGRMRIKVTIDAPGVKAAGGTLIVVANLAGVKHKRIVKVGKGAAVARFVGLPPGRYYVSAAYSGTARVLGGRVHDHVKVPRRGRA